MRKYKVIKDLQGGEFAMYTCEGDNEPRIMSIAEWKRQALEWASSDNNNELYDLVKKTPSSHIISIISCNWDLVFEEVCLGDKALGDKAFRKLYTNIKRIDTISFPTWKEFIKLKYFNFPDKFHRPYTIRYNDYMQCIYITENSFNVRYTYIFNEVSYYAALKKCKAIFLGKY